MMCETCLEKICFKCAALTHRTHEIKTFKELEAKILEEIKTKIQYFPSSKKKYIQQIENYEKELGEKKRNLNLF
jgi:hypothetical protein